MANKLDLYESLKQALKELENEESKIINIKDLNRNEINEEKELTEKVNNIYNEREFEVLTDGQIGWVSLEDMEQIKLALSKNMHILFQDMSEDNHVVLGKTYLRITLEQVKLINKYTFDPKFVPKLRLIMEREPRERSDSFDGPSMSR